MSDLVVRNGTIVDGTGGEPYVGDVLVQDGQITQIGNVGEVDARELDAAGLSVSPGFIDIHSHSDYTLLVDPRAVSAVHQGVTLEVVGNCGHGCFPVHDAGLARNAIYGYDDDVPLTWSDAAGYFERLEEARPAVNVLSLVPNGQLRLGVVGIADRGATEEELRAMEARLEQGLEEGAWGFSTGLEYAAETGVPEAEIERLCRTVARFDALYATHTRYRDEGARDAVEEAVRTAGRAGVRLQVSHLIPRSGLAEGERCIEVVDRARERGLDVAFDMHTRLFGFTYLATVLPAWALDDGPAGLGEILRDPAARGRMKSHRSILSAGGDWGRIVLLDNDVWPDASRRSIAELAAERGQEPLDTVYDLLRDGGDERNGLMAMIRCHNEEQQQRRDAAATAARTARPRRGVPRPARALADERRGDAALVSGRGARHESPRLSTRPARVPVRAPSSSVTAPLTTTCRMPVASWFGSYVVPHSPNVSGSKTAMSAGAPARSRPRSRRPIRSAGSAVIRLTASAAVSERVSRTMKR